MAYTGWSTSDYLDAAFVGPSRPFWMLSWAYMATTAPSGNRTFATMYDNTASNNYLAHGYEGNSVFSARVVERNGILSRADISVPMVVGWNMLVSRHPASGDFEAILNADHANSATGGSQSPSLSRVSIGVGNRSAGRFEQHSDPVGLVCIGSGEISDAEIDSLYHGFHPLLVVGAGRIIECWNLVRPLGGLKGVALSAVGSLSVADHHAIIYPQSRRALSFGAGAPPTTNRRRRFFMGAA